MSCEWGMFNAYFVYFIFAGLGIWYVFISFGRERIPIVMYVVICKRIGKRSLIWTAIHKR